MASVKNKDKVIARLLTAKTPAQYIDFCVKSGAPKGYKIRATRLWLEKHKKFSLDDIQYARNRHPYWKERKAVNHNERSRRRFAEYNYYKTGKKKSWKEADLKLFIKLNKDSIDRELARRFKVSIPSIQGLRRRLNLGRKIAEAQKVKKVSSVRLLKYISTDEKSLREELIKAGGLRKKRR